TATPADPNQSNNSATNSSTVVVGADLALTVSHSGSFTAGSTGVFVVLVSNPGPSSAADVTLVLVLSAGLTFKSGTGCTAAGATVTCAIGALASGSSRSVSVSVTVDPAVVGSVNVSGTVSTSSSDPVSSNNSAADTATV